MSLSNVLAVVTDSKLQQCNVNGVQYYEAQIVMTSDYYPFGMLMEDTTNWRQDTSYRFGFNGYENLNFVAGEGSVIDFGARIYDSRISRFLSIDPRYGDFPWQSTYCFAGNSPTSLIDKIGEGPEKPDPNLVLIYNQIIWPAIKDNAKINAEGKYISDQGYTTMDDNYGTTRTGNTRQIPIKHKEWKSKWIHRFNTVFSSESQEHKNPNRYTKRIKHTRKGKTLFTFTLEIRIAPDVYNEKTKKIDKNYNNVTYVDPQGLQKADRFGNEYEGKYLVFLRANKPDPIGDPARQGRVAAIMIFDTKKDYDAYLLRVEQAQYDELIRLAEADGNNALADYYRENYPTNEKDDSSKTEENKKE